MILRMMIGSLFLTFAMTGFAVEPTPDRGIYAIWYKNREDLLKLPFVRGGQVFAQWADVEKTEGDYDFSVIDEQLKKFHDIGRKATVQINGNHKPDYLFDKVAILPRAVHHQVEDKKGTLQFWDPIHRDAYINMVKAFGEHMKASPHKDAILGVRMNFNAVGTEQGTLKDADTQWKNWTPAPDGHVHEVDWSPQVYEQYRKDVADAFIASFTPDIRLFFRGTNGTKGYEELMATGRIGLFQTGSEIEPRQEGGYAMFRNLSRPGKCLAYAESWADAWGVHGVKTDPRFFTPCQYNYWRLISDLNNGVSFIAVYGNDLAAADQPEFRAGFEFAAKYAGFHASPEQSPGAWVALREGNFNKGDYTFLMQRLKESSQDTGVDKQGPDDQRFGQWARAIEGDQKMSFTLDKAFTQSLKGSPASVRVVYLDNGLSEFNIFCDAGETALSQTVKKQDSGRWKEEVISIPAADFQARIGGADIVLATTEKTVFHMVEVSRETTAGD